MNFFCRECDDEISLPICQVGLQVYRVCLGCGPGWFDSSGKRLDMIQSQGDFIAKVAPIPDTSVAANHDGVGVVLRDGRSFAMKFPFTVDEFVGMIDSYMNVRR